MNRINRHLVALVAMLLSGLLLLLAAPAQAQFATGGSGIYRNNILWFEWGDAPASISQAGITRSNTITVAGQSLIVTCSLSNIGGTGINPDLRIYRPGGYAFDGLDKLYNIGGSLGANTMDIGIALRTNAQTANFTFACSATLGGVPYPLTGLIFADAETTNGGEFIRTTPTAGSTMRVIERIRAPGCTFGYNVSRTAGNVHEFRSADLNGCDDPPDPMGIYFLDGATSADITFGSGQGLQAVAVGVMLHTADYGDAPGSYGAAGHLPQMTWSGGTIPVGTTDILGAGFALATLQQPATALLGARVDLESPNWASATALLDDSNGTPDDEDGVNPATLAVLSRGMAGTLYTVPVTCAGTAPVAGWIDFDRDGAFQADERSATATCGGGSATLNWAAVNADIVAGQSYLRVRTALAAADIANPTGLAFSGEAEDYAITIVDPRIRVAKITNGVVGGPFAFTTTNTVTLPAGLTTVTAGTAVVGAPVSITSLGTAVVVTESTLPAGWALTALTCSNTGGTPLVASYDLPTRTATIPSASLSTTSDITCTFTNARVAASLQIVKAGLPATVPTGGLVNYTITVTNDGAVPVTGAQVLDTVGAGLDCTTPPLAAPTCTACAAAITAAALTTAPGVTLTTLTTGAVATITLQCRATATGQ